MIVIFPCTVFEESVANFANFSVHTHDYESHITCAYLLYLMGASHMQLLIVGMLVSFYVQPPHVFRTSCICLLVLLTAEEWILLPLNLQSTQHS